MTSQSPRQVSARAFDALMEALPPALEAEHIAVAVSGGPDSMALTLLLDAWTRKAGKRLTALTVDHGLRPESAAEAKTVKGWLAERGISHATLTWQGEKPASNVQAKARDARYALMDAWCAANGASCLALAHQLEDQAETFLLRLGRGSGVHGLAAMEACLKPASADAPWRIRPLLDVPKDKLKATLGAYAQDWIEDPSNAQAKYSRVRVRALKEPLASLGLTPERLAVTARHMARARAFIDQETDRVLSKSAELSLAGYCSVDVRTLTGAHEEVGLRALTRILMAVSGASYPPRFERLERLWSTLVSGGLGGGATLLGCRIMPASADRILVFRERRAVGDPVGIAAGQSAIWDGRYQFQMECIERPKGRLTVDRLGRDGWKALCGAAPELADQGVPDIVQHMSPAVWDASGLLAAPAHRYFRPESPEETGFFIEYLPGTRDRVFARDL